jgi:hypothetical protein
VESLEQLWQLGYFSQPERFRLAFREFGATIGVQVRGGGRLNSEQIGWGSHEVRYRMSTGTIFERAGSEVLQCVDIVGASRMQASCH